MHTFRPAYVSLRRHIVRIGVCTFLGGKESHVEGGESVTLLYTTYAKP
jgi:hypothetical protein